MRYPRKLNSGISTACEIKSSEPRSPSPTTLQRASSAAPRRNFSPFFILPGGSAGEVRSMLCLLERLLGFADLKSEISNLKSVCEGISRQLHGWANSLQNTEIKGPRYLTDKSRRTVVAIRDRREFLEEDRKSTRLNSSHGYISYAVFCLKKKNKYTRRILTTQRRHS